MSKTAVRPTVRPSAGGRHGLPVEELVRAFSEVRTELLGALFFWLGNHDDAQDAAQDAFLKCWRARATMGDVRNLRAWIFRVALNAAKDLQRSAWRRRARPLTTTPFPCPCSETSPADELVDREALERVREALVDLRAEEKEVFLLRQNGSLTYEEIAELRRSPIGTVKTQMRAALHKLRLVLNPQVSAEG